MSVRSKTIVWTMSQSCVHNPVFLAMASFVQDPRYRCYPSVARLAWLTSDSKHTDQRELRKLERIEVIVPVVNRSGGIGRATEHSAQYRHLDCPQQFVEPNRLAILHFARLFKRRLAA